MKSATAASKEEPMSANIKHVPRSGTVRTNGQELFYEIHGDGPPLVLLMGIGYDSSLWTLQQVPVLSTRFRVVLLDNRDAGRSSRADHPYTIADMADDVAGLLDALDIHRTHLLGLSMGSMIGMEFALRHADRLDRLVLAGPGAAPARSAVDPISIWNWVKANDPSGEVFGGQQFTWLFSSAFLRNQQAVQETIALLASNPNPVEPEAYDRQAQAYLQFDALDRLGGIKAPTLVIVGEQDLLTPAVGRARGGRRDPRSPVRDHHRRRFITRGAAGTPRRLQSTGDGLPGRVTPPYVTDQHRWTMPRRSHRCLRRELQSVPEGRTSGRGYGKRRASPPPTRLSFPRSLDWPSWRAVLETSRGGERGFQMKTGLRSS